MNQADQSASSGADTPNPGSFLAAAAALDAIDDALRTARHEAHGAADAQDVGAERALASLLLLRQVREQLAGWETGLIETARQAGASWADLAHPLGVASRQAAERRYLRGRPGPAGTTGEQRVQATRERRAAERTSATWARRNAADLRRIAGQITALTDLPPAQAAWLPYDGASVPEFGDGSESPMGGPVYHYDPALDSPVKFPEAYDGDFFAGEFGRRWIKRIETGADGTVQSINAFPWTGTQVMDMAFGPDGALYVLDYGTAWFGGDDNSALYRIENATDGHSPVARAAADKTSGQAALKVRFSSAGTTDQDGDTLTHHWDFGDGSSSTAANPTHTYRQNGTYTATLTAEDPSGRTGSAAVRVVVGNTAPTVTLQLPQDGQLFSFGDAVPFTVKVSDPEDGRNIDCSKVTVHFILGHDTHGHPLTSAKGCSGTIQTSADGGHDENEDIFGVFDAEYTDNGGGGQAALTSHDQNVTQPRHRQAEHYTDSSGVTLQSKDTAHGGKTVGDIHSGDWISFSPYALGNARKITARVSSGGAGGTLEIRAGSAKGTLLGKTTVPVTGGWETFQDVSADLSRAPKATTTLFLVFKGGTGALFDVDDFTFTTG